MKEGSGWRDGERKDSERAIVNYTRKVLSLFKAYGIPETKAGIYGLCFLFIQRSMPDYWMVLRRAGKARSSDAAGIFQEAIGNLALPGECAPPKESGLEEFSEMVWKLTTLFEDISLNGENVRMGVSDRLAEAAYRGYSTPLPVADLIVELVGSLPWMTFYDPVCRTGSLLVRCARHIIQNYSEPYVSFRGTVSGDEDYCITWLNLAVNGLEGGGIERFSDSADRVRSFPDVGEDQFDLVLLDLVEWPEYIRPEGGRFPYDEFKGYPARWDSLVMLVPGKALAGRSYTDLREWLVESDALEAIVRLPNGLFPSIRVDVDLLLICPEKPMETKGRILFVDASGLPVDRGRKALADEQARTIVNLYSTFHRKGEIAAPGIPDLHCQVVSTREIELRGVPAGSRGRGYDLDVSHYVVPEPEPVDLEAEFARLAGYKHRRGVLAREMEEQMEWVLERIRRE